MRTALACLALLPALAHASPAVQGIDGSYEEPALDEEVNWVETRLPALGIVGGETTSDFDNVLAIVAYFGDGQGFNFCSGTQISDDFVLTAAHCAEAGESYVGQGATLYVARTANVYQTPEDAWFAIAGDGVYIHPDWPGMDAQEVIHDVALLRATSPILTNDGPAVLNDEPIDDSWIGRELRFVGFGITDDGAQDSGIKRTTSIPVGDHEFGIVYSYAPNTNVCSGDSGGAAFESTADGLELAGVNSFVFQIDWETDPCDGGANGAARVDSYLEWILGIEPDVRTDWEPVEAPEDPNDPNNPGDTGDALSEVDPADTELRAAGCVCNASATPASAMGLGLLLIPLVLRRRS